MAVCISLFAPELTLPLSLVLCTRISMNLLRSFRPLSLILLLAGTEPIHEGPQSAWWKKLNRIGLFFCVLQLTFTLLGYAKESERAEATAHFRNNINRLTILQKQWFTISVPVIYILTKFYHLRHLELFHSRLARFDALLRVGSGKHQMDSRRALKRMEEASWRWNVIGALCLIFGEVLNFSIGAAYIYATTQRPPEAITFYFYQVTVVNFIGTAFDIGIKLNGVKMRLQLLLDMQKLIVRDIVKVELEKRRISVLFKG